MKKIVFAAVATAMFGATGASFAAGQEDATKLGCDTCHAPGKKMAYQEIAKKYKGNADAEKLLVAKLVEGKGVHAKMKGKDAEAATIVKWILAQ